MAQTFSSQVAATVRPWGLLTAIALTYAAYTLSTGAPERMHRIAPRTALPAVHLRLPVLTMPHTVVKCVQDGTTTYSDRPCAPDTIFDILLLPSD
jgi:hypothetical protein